MSFLINSYAFSVAGPDVTPDALNANYNADNNYLEDVHSNAYFRITGIDSSISLKVSYEAFSVYYKIVNTNPVGIEELENPITNEWTYAGNNEIISISNNQWILFAGDCGSGTGEWAVEILNNSSSDTLLTTVNIVAAYTPP